MAKAAEAFRTISEVADELDLHKHVLRFWEVKFPQIKPMKRGGGRRYYRPADLDLLRGIRHLLHAEGYTIKGVQRILRERGIDSVKQIGGELAAGGPVSSARALLGPDTGADGSDGGNSDGMAAKDESLPLSPAIERRATGAAQKGRRQAAKGGPDLSRAVRAAIAELESCRAILKGIEPAEAVAPPANRRSTAGGR